MMMLTVRMMSVFASALVYALLIFNCVEGFQNIWKATLLRSYSRRTGMVAVDMSRARATEIKRSESKTNKKMFYNPSYDPPLSAMYEESDGKIDLLYDSECPICAMEVEFLKKRDYNHKIKFTDLQSADYNAAEHGNIDFEKGMRKIRAILPDKRVVTGVEVFRHTYEAIGLGWMFAITKLPVVGDIADAAYDLWAEHRLRLTGRGELADVLRQRAEALSQSEPIDECDDVCDLDWGDENENEVEVDSDEARQ